MSRAVIRCATVDGLPDRNHNVVPGSQTATCAGCRRRIWVAPTTVNEIRKDRTIALLCEHCS